MAVSTRVPAPEITGLHGALLKIEAAALRRS